MIRYRFLIAFSYELSKKEGRVGELLAPMHTHTHTHHARTHTHTTHTRTHARTHTPPTHTHKHTKRARTHAHYTTMHTPHTTIYTTHTNTHAQARQRGRCQIWGCWGIGATGSRYCLTSYQNTRPTCPSRTFRESSSS